jgi:hypothetical protein
MYKITCIARRQIYNGQSKNPQYRYTQHKQPPPTWMKANVAKYVPFDEYFILDTLCLCTYKAKVNSIEGEMI